MLFRVWVGLRKGQVRKGLVMEDTFELSVERRVCIH